MQLSKEAKEWIRQNEKIDIQSFLLKHKTLFEVPASFLAQQLHGRQKAKLKLPSFYQNENMVYPPGINLEQCSSETTAVFKKILIQTLTNKKSAVDLTGGFGVDSFFLSTLFEEFHYVEPDLGLLQTVKENHQSLGAGNISYHHSTAEEFLQSTNQNFDLVYIDPSRRVKDKKVLTFQDCVPDITILQQTIFERTNHLLVKASPLLDIKQGLRSLQFVKKVLVVSVENDCKELLFFCEKGFTDQASIEAVNLKTNHPSFTFLFSEEENTEAQFSEPLVYLYEPNSSIMKAGAFKSVSKHFNIKKLAVNTHLYTSQNLFENFSGRCFQIIAPVKADKKHMSEFFSNNKANIITRNYPLSVEELKKKTGLQDGGDLYLIGCADANKKWLLVAKRMY